MKEKRIFDRPGINSYSLNESYIIPQRHLKNDLIAIQQKYSQQPMTRENIENMYDDLINHFKFFMLDDFKFKLTRDIQKGKIIFEPIGELNKLALIGIMSLE